MQAAEAQSPRVEAAAEAVGAAEGVMRAEAVEAQSPRVEAVPQGRQDRGSHQGVEEVEQEH